MSDLEKRFNSAQQIVEAAAQTALQHFTDHDSLRIESKGDQDWVSNADREVELQIRSALSKQFPDDSIIGEEHDKKTGSSPYTWVIDPIDGTTSFVNAMPGWCVVIACLDQGETVIGVIVDPIAKELYCACKGLVATMNGKPITVSSAESIKEGSVAVGHSARLDPHSTLKILSALVLDGGIFYRIGSGALMLAYVAGGRLLAYIEPHMYAWDCLAGLFIIEQAGGRIEAIDTSEMLASGGQVLAAAPGVYDHVLAMSRSGYEKSAT